VRALLRLLPRLPADPPALAAPGAAGTCVSARLRACARARLRLRLLRSALTLTLAASLGSQDDHVHRNFCAALRKRAWVEGLHQRVPRAGSSSSPTNSRRRRGTKRARGPAVSTPTVDLTQDEEQATCS
jgi:hypothetical protein